MQNRSRSRSSSQSSYRDQRDNRSFIEPSKRLFIAGISQDVFLFLTQTPRDEIRGMFEKVGTVVDFFMKKGEDKPSFGFVEMSSLEEASEAISLLSGKTVNDSIIMVKYAKPRKERAEGDAPRPERNNDRNNFNRGGPRDNQGPKPMYGRPQGNRDERPRWNRDDQEEGRQGGYGKQDRFEADRGGYGQRREDRSSEGGRPPVASKPITNKPAATE